MPKKQRNNKKKIKVFYEKVENGIYRCGYQELTQKEFEKLYKGEKYV